MSITLEGRPVSGSLERVLSLAAANPESFGLDRNVSDANFTYEELAQVLNQGHSSDRVLDEWDRDYFVSQGLLPADEFRFLAYGFFQRSLRGQTQFSVSPSLFYHRDTVSASPATSGSDRCEELEERLWSRGPAGLAGLLGLGLPLGPGSPFVLGTALMINGSGGVGDLVEYVNSGCVD